MNAIKVYWHLESHEEGKPMIDRLGQPVSGWFYYTPQGPLVMSREQCPPVDESWMILFCFEGAEDIPDAMFEAMTLGLEHAMFGHPPMPDNANPDNADGIVTRAKCPACTGDPWPWFATREELNKFGQYIVWTGQAPAGNEFLRPAAIH